MTDDKGGPVVLFHYTSLASMISIVTNRVLWASSIHHMNDGTEFKLGFDLLQDQVRGLANTDATLRPFTEDLQHALNSYR